MFCMFIWCSNRNDDYILYPPPLIWLEDEMCDGRRDKCVSVNQLAAVSEGNSGGGKNNNTNICAAVQKDLQVCD